MPGYWRLYVVMMAALLHALAGAGHAAPPWSTLLSTHRVEADPNKDYAISEANGPWMIMATTFSGDGAEQQARELVLELRKRYKLTAYTYSKTFDYTGPVEARGVDHLGRPLTMQYRHKGEFEEIAVLVGDYASVDAPDAQRTLQKIKLAQPDSLALKNRDKTNQSFAGLRTVQKMLLPEPPPPSWVERYGERKAKQLWAERKNKGPMGHAMVTTNPLLPADYFTPKGLDRIIVDMNRGVKYSLLDCPGKYTVNVATFTGHALLLDRKTTQAISEGAEPKSWLVDAAKNAHTLTMELRKQGVEAYEFHDRAASIVTVGSFNSVGTPRADGQTEINPAVLVIMNHFGADKKVVPGQAPVVGKAKSLVGVPFDVQPMPVEVPRRSLAADYARAGSAE